MLRTDANHGSDGGARCIDSTGGSASFYCLRSRSVWFASRERALRWRAIVLGALLLGQTTPGLAEEQVKSAIPAAPQVAAGSWCLAVNDDGRLLGHINGHQTIEPSGLSKLMTLYLVFDALKDQRLALTDTVQVDEQAWRTPGSRMYLPLNSRPQVDDLIAGLILYNANDAATALAIYLSGSIEAFTATMNDRAHLMAMNQTFYTHPAGLQDEASTTTACDQLILMRYLRTNYPEYGYFFSMLYRTFSGSVRNNPNSLLRNMSGATGMLSVQSSDNRFSAAISTDRDGMALNFVLIGAGSRAGSLTMSSSVINHFYRHYVRVRVYDALEYVRSAAISYGEQDKIELGAIEEVSIIVPFNQRKEIEVTANANQLIEAPIRRGERLGTIKISYQGHTLVRQPLVALRHIKRVHWHNRLWNNLTRLFDH